MPLPPVKAHQHSWIHGLPLKMRFRRSQLYISIIPPIILGIIVGVLTAVMGVGGGFIMIPAMIYLLRMPTNVVIGTSQFQILFVTAAATILHAATRPDGRHRAGIPAGRGGVIGVQMGVRVGSQMRGEQLRALLAVLVVAGRAETACRPRAQRRRTSTPSSRVRHEDRAGRHGSLLCGDPVGRVPANAADLVSGLSTDLIQITSNFTGADIVLFGAIEPAKNLGPIGRLRIWSS